MTREIKRECDLPDFSDVCFHWEASKSRGWHGLVPLHSTRNAVERLLGKAKGYIVRYAAGLCKVPPYWLERAYKHSR
jgi:hypothetical protein